MFLNEKAQSLIEDLRDEKAGGVEIYKAAISDAMSIIILMHETHANTNWEKKELIEALNILVNYNQLITALSKEK
jgi:hypothetical protein